ncbi:MAG: fibronectin type III domain-containing protein [Vicinamibacterales bacterium]
MPLVFSETPPVAAAPSAPGAPQNVLASSSGGTVAITWSAPITGGAPTSYVLEAGTAPGLANLATVPVPGTSFTATGVPRGTYYIRVRGVNTIGTGPASADVQLVVS